MNPYHSINNHSFLHMLLDAEKNRTMHLNFRNARILLIEDNPDCLEIMISALKSSLPEVEAVTASSAVQALSILAEITATNGKLPKLVLLDLYIPRREDGWKVLKKIKEQTSALIMLPVIILSTTVHAGDIREAYENGCSAYTIKPTDYPAWVNYFQDIREHWMETVVLPYKMD